MNNIIHVPPSYFVKTSRRYKSWCNVVQCSNCGLVAKYEDCHPVHPCPNCGRELIEKVGRWITTLSSIWFIRKEKGYWELLDRRDTDE